MATSKKILHEGIRNRYLAKLVEYLTAEGEEVLRTGANEIAMPCVDEEGNDEYIVLTFKVPTGTRDGEPYDGHDEAAAYADHIAEKAAKTAKAKAEKAAKIERDKATRAAKAAAKAARGE